MGPTAKEMAQSHLQKLLEEEAKMNQKAMEESAFAMARKDERTAKLEAALGELWDLYENGVACQEEHGDSIEDEAYLGNAVKPSEDLEKRIAELLDTTGKEKQI